MATALAYALKSRFDNVERFGDVDTGAPAADGSPAQPVPQEKKTEQERTVGRLALFDLLMGILMVIVAWGYNSVEVGDGKGGKVKAASFGVKVLTCVFAFFFWHLYGLYFLIRAGALQKAYPLGSPTDVKDMFTSVLTRGRALSTELRQDLSSLGSRGSLGGYYDL